MKRLNIRKIRIEEVVESQLQGPEDILNKIIEENFLNLKKEMPIKTKAYRTTIKLDQKRKSCQHTAIKPYNLQNKERILKAPREKG